MERKSTAERLKQIMSERNLKQVDILEMARPYAEKYNIKLNKGELSQFVNGKVEPGQWKLTILGLALDVSEAWLMGYNVPKERDASPQPSNIYPVELKQFPDAWRNCLRRADMGGRGQRKLCDGGLQY